MEYFIFFSTKTRQINGTMQNGLQIKQREFPRISLLFEPWKAWGCGVFVHMHVVTHSPVRPCFLWQSPGRRQWLAPSSLFSWNPCWPSRPPSKQESRRTIREHTKVEDGKGGRMDEKIRTNTELKGKKQVFLDLCPLGSKRQTLTRSAQKKYWKQKLHCCDHLTKQPWQ